MARQHRNLRRWLVYGPPRRLAEPLFGALVGAELAAVRTLDAVRPAPATPGGVTALIKTFERPQALRRLVDSIHRRYPKLPILVVDDSREPSRLEGVQTITLPFDSGVSAGRQAGLEAITTPCTLLLDDDYVFYAGTRLDLPLATLRQEPAIDLVAGQRIDLPDFRVADPRGALWPTTATPLRPLGSTLADLPVVDKTPNFFVARTDKLREVGWDPNIKRIDHAEFFTRALGKLVCVQDHRWSVLHAQTPFDDHYLGYRMAIETDRRYIARKHGLE